MSTLDPKKLKYYQLRTQNPAAAADYARQNGIQAEEDTLADQVKNVSMGEPAQSANRGPNPEFANPGNPTAGRIIHPAQPMSDDERQIAAYQSQNAAQAQQDPMFAAKMQAQRAAVQKFRDAQEAPQLQALSDIEAQKKKKPAGPEVYPAEE